MSIMRSLHTPITLGISTLLLLGLVVQYTEASSQVYPTDGIWEDTFDDRADVTLTNCDVLGGAIVLNTTLSEVSYNFDAQKNHQAYAFQSFFFFPLWKYYSPQRHLTSETKIGSNDLYKIKALDQDYAERSSKGFLFSYVAHHFRFKIDIDPETIDYVLLRWYGKADARSNVKFYYYNTSYLLVGGWESLSSNVSDGNDFSVVLRIRSGQLKLAMKDSDYLDILVVGNIFSRVSTLSTNYIEVLAQTSKGFTLIEVIWQFASCSSKRAAFFSRPSSKLIKI